jgi:hypothetical protein
VRFPFDLYKGDKQWVPPLIGGVKTQLNANKHPFYKHSAADFFLTECKGKILDRITLLHNTHFNEHSRENAVQFTFSRSWRISPPPGLCLRQALTGA